MTDTGITGLNILPTRMLYITVHAQLRASCLMFTPKRVAAFLKRRNITPPFHIEKVADCSLYLAANVAHFLTKRGCWYFIHLFTSVSSSKPAE